jgi:Arc/MetJ family transcription regulator
MALEEIVVDDALIAKAAEIQRLLGETSAYTPEFWERHNRVRLARISDYSGHRARDFTDVVENFQGGFEAF